VYDEGEVNPDFLWAELQIEDRAKLVMYGVVTTELPSLSSHQSMRYFKRYSSVRDSDWTVRAGQWDGLTWIPSRDIKVYGMGLF